ncbi:hypothetical protein [Streptomyces sp. NPDC051704]|uniref:hypothetical protein n=1 Tax=Streptomyces sp. NPDC051704 TaxID=3365671 RepID=UPI00378F371C
MNEMTSIAVTGHANITDASKPLIGEALVSRLARRPAAELTGMSCLAAGADRLFADAVLALGARLVAVLPSWDYRERMVDPAHADEFDPERAATPEDFASGRADPRRPPYDPSS